MSILDDIKEQFPQYAFLADEPDVGALLREAIEVGLTDTQFLARLRETGWWKRTAQTERQFLDLLHTDPATARRNIDAKGQSLKVLAAELGVVIPADRIRSLAEFALRKGLTGDELREWLLHQLPRALPLSVRQDLRETAAQYMVGVPPKDFDWWNRVIAAGIRSKDQFDELMRSRAKNKFPHLGNLIDQGFLPGQIYEEHKQAIAEEFDRPSDSINLLRDPAWKRVTRPNPDGTMWTIEQTIEYARSRPEWRKTDRAQSMAAELTNNLLEVFGKRS